MSACPGCRARLPSVTGTTHPYVGASAGCWEVYGELLAREYSDPRYMAVHRLTVDAYCAQHPGEPERRSIQSVSVHLVGLHLVLDRGADGAFARHVIAAITTMPAERLVWLTSPAHRGELTVLDVMPARDADDHGARVRRWAASVWSAWTPHHDSIARLANEALEQMKRS
jgi:hypothetical protein